MKLSRFFLFIFFISGFASLIYEIIWTRMLVFIFGNTSHSVAVVISVFMAGLSFGSYIFGKIADRTKNLIFLYALVELFTAFFGLISPILIGFSKSLFINQANLIISNRNLEILIKVVISFLILFPATFFMGGTLPILIKLFNKLYGRLSKQAGKLYGANTLGAVFGVLFSGFILIELFGLMGSLLIAVAINILVALSALYYSKLSNLSVSKSVRLKKFPESGIKQNRFLQYSNKKIIFLILIYTISGFISLSYEVLWTRLITPASGIYIYGFTLMLAIFLLGIALGSFLYQRYFSGRIDTFIFIGILQVLLSLFAFFIIIFVSFFMPIWSRYIYRMFVPIIVFLPPTLCMGMMFPAITEVYTRVSNVAEKIGTVYALNSFGSILGSIVATFVLIPQLGTVESILILAIIGCLLGLFLILQTKYIKFRYIYFFSALFVISLNIFGIYNAQGLLMPRVFKVYIKDHLKLTPELKYYIAEDSVASVLAITSPTNKRIKGLFIDGIETTGLVEETKLIAHLPILAHPDPKNVLVVAFGMGTTYRSALSYPQLNVDVVELVPNIPKFMPLFHTNGKEVLKNSRGNVIINDGRNYVFVTPKKYDVVTIDPPPPTNGAGTTVLFSDQFYKDINRKLNKGGIVQNWIFFDLDIDSTRMIAQTFKNNFTYVNIYLSQRGLGMYLLGSDKPIDIPKQRVDTLTQIPGVSKDMSEWTGHIYSWEKLNNMYVGSQEDLNKFTQNAAIITDYFPRTEYSLLRLITKSSSKMNKDILLSSIQY